MSLSISKRVLVPIAFLFAMALSACATGTGTIIPVPSLTPTLISTSTVTPVPLAVSVNGQGFTVPEFKAELARYQQAQASLGNTVNLDTATQAVADDLVDTLLLEQGATAAGYVVDDATVQARMDALVAQMGGVDKLTAWETAHGYTETDFSSSLRLQIAAAWMRGQIAASVPATAEQVHARQILFYNAVDAQQALGFLQSGVNFNDLAAQYDPVTKGELGWFPRGYLPSTVIEDAVFALQPDQYSAVIQDETGYHILYVVERDPARQLSPDALLALQERAVQSWLTQQKNQSTIVVTP
jgi:peptidyl-prolyl cis-trans isomerase C